jgi:hypothetical protein
MYAAKRLAAVDADSVCGRFARRWPALLQRICRRCMSSHGGGHGCWGATAISDRP